MSNRSSIKDDSMNESELFSVNEELSSTNRNNSRSKKLSHRSSSTLTDNSDYHARPIAPPSRRSVSIDADDEVVLDAARQVMLANMSDGSFSVLNCVDEAYHRKIAEASLSEGLTSDPSDVPYRNAQDETILSSGQAYSMRSYQQHETNPNPKQLPSYPQIHRQINNPGAHRMFTSGRNLQQTLAERYGDDEPDGIFVAPSARLVTADLVLENSESERIQQMEEQLAREREEMKRNYEKRLMSALSCHSVEAASVVSVAEKGSENEMMSKKMRYVIFGLLCIILLGCAIGAAVGIVLSRTHRPEEDESSIKDFNLTILHVNDIGSHLRGESISLGTSMHDGISAVNDAIVHLGGFPRIVKAMDQVLENTELNVLKLHAGDALIGTKYFSGFRGKADADMMNRICFHAFVPGNEDFTEGFPSFLRNDLFGQTSLCQDTRVVCANLEIGHGSPMEDLVLSGHISSSRIVDFRSNHKVGIVGITGKKKAQMRWLGRNTTVLDERQAAENEIEYLTSIGVDKIVLLTHIGFENDLRWMLELEGVDIIVGGDSRSFLGNTELESDTDPLLKDILSDEGRYDGKYPTTRLNSAGKLVCIVQAWEHAKAFGKLDVTFDADGNLKSCGGRTVVPFQVDESVPADLRIQIASNLEGLGDAFFETQEDDATAAALAFYDEKLKNFRIIARVRFPGICLERIPGEGKHTVICTSEQTASQGGGVGNLVAQAYLHEIGADIALQNAGGIRSDLYHGNFSNLDANTLLPFSNALIALGIKGHQIKTFLEEAIEQALQTEGDGAYPYCAGLRFVVYEGGGPYNRISQLEVNRRLGEGTWSLVDPNTTYTIVTNAYLADGNDGYDEFRNVPENVRVDTGTFDTEAFISFAESRGILTDPPSDTYSTQQFIRETMAPTSVAPATVAPVTASPSAEDVS